MNRSDLDDLRRREFVAYKEKRRLRRAFLEAKNEQDDLEGELADARRELISTKAKISKIINRDTVPSADSTDPYDKYLYAKQRILKRIDALELLAQEQKDLKNDCYNLAALRSKEGKKHEQAGYILEAKDHEEMMLDYNSQIYDLWAEIDSYEQKARKESGLGDLEKRLGELKSEMSIIKTQLEDVARKTEQLKREYSKARSRHAFLKEGIKKAENNPPGE